MSHERPKPTAEQLSKVLRSLADRHAAERTRLSAERNWSRLQAKLQAKSTDRGPLRVLLRPTALRVLKPRMLALTAAMFLGVGLLSLGSQLGFGSPLGLGQLLGFGPSSAEALRFAVREPSTSDVASELRRSGWLRTQAAGARVDFSDGSRLDVNGSSTLHIEATGEHAATAELVQGGVTAEIVHADTTRWQLLAGPFSVEVVGTRFELSYEHEIFALVMQAGRVRVTGRGQTWILETGQQLRLPASGPLDPSGESHDLTNQADATPVTASGGVAPSGPASPAKSESNGIAAETARDPVLSAQGKATKLDTSQSAVQPTNQGRRIDAREWPRWVAKGQFERVLNQAHELGASIPGGLSEPELGALAQAAGYSGDSRLAERCWRHLRQHFARSNGSSKAAFYLARIAEQRGDTKEALEWLTIYGRESPSGALAAEALGRHLLLLRKTEGSSGARAIEVARDYLRRFPDGAYREMAQTTLDARRAGH